MDSKNQFRLSRRDFLGAAAGMGAAAATVGLSNTAMAADGQLGVLINGGSWGQWFQQAFADPFSKQSGAEFTWKFGTGFEPLVISQRQRPQWDLIHCNQTSATQMGFVGAAVEWKEAEIPNLKNVHPSFKFSHLAGMCHTPYGIAYNKTKITRPINSWWDLWDPEFAGHVAFPDFAWTSDDVFYAFNALAGGDSTNIEPGLEKLKELYQKNKAVTVRNAEHFVQLMTSGDVWIIGGFYGRVTQVIDSGVPLEFVYPKEGGMSWIYNTAMVANRGDDQSALAKKFVNITLDPQQQIEFSRLTGNPPTNIEAINNLPKDLERMRLTEDQLTTLGALQRNFDAEAQFRNRDILRDRWAKEVLGA